jgi:hypothetical protein
MVQTAVFHGHDHDVINAGLVRRNLVKRIQGLTAKQSWGQPGDRTGGYCSGRACDSRKKPSSIHCHHDLQSQALMSSADKWIVWKAEISPPLPASQKNQF